jgi:hypothetical protein
LERVPGWVLRRWLELLGLFALVLRWPLEDGLRVRRAAWHGHLPTLSVLAVGALLQGVPARHGRLDGPPPSGFNGCAHQRRVANRSCSERQTHRGPHSGTGSGPQADGQGCHSGRYDQSYAICPCSGTRDHERGREADDHPDRRTAFGGPDASERASGAGCRPLDTATDDATAGEHGSAVYAERADQPRHAEQASGKSAFNTEHAGQPSDSEPSVHAHHAAVQPAVGCNAPADDTERAEQTTGEPALHTERAQQATGQPAFDAECAQQEQATSEQAFDAECAQQTTGQPAFNAFDAECA